MLINEKISRQLKELRMKRGYTLDEMAEIAMVSKQGYHNWEQGLRTWRLDVLTELSTILGFEMQIRGGELTLTEVADRQINNEVKVMEKQVNALKEQTELKGFEVITLYTGVDNINFEDKEILDEVLIYTDKEEAQDVFQTKVVVPVYALFDTEAGNVCYNTYGLDKTRAYSHYFWNYAPIIKGDSPLFGDSVVYVDTEKNIKVAKGHVVIDINNRNADGSFPILDVLKHETKQTLGMFITTDMDGFMVPQLDCFSEDFPNIMG